MSASEAATFEVPNDPALRLDAIDVAPDHRSQARDLFHDLFRFDPCGDGGAWLGASSMPSPAAPVNRPVGLETVHTFEARS